MELRSYALVGVVNVNERFNRTVVEDECSGGVGNNAHFAYGHVEQVGFGNNSARRGSVAAHGERFTRNRFGSVAVGVVCDYLGVELLALRQAVKGNAACFGHFASEVEARAAVAGGNFLACGVFDGNLVVKHHVVIHGLSESYGALVRLPLLGGYLRVGEVRRFAAGVRGVRHVRAVVWRAEVPRGFYLFAAVRVDTAYVNVREVLNRNNQAFLHVRRACGR